jgi:hypothetical protein
MSHWVDLAKFDDDKTDIVDGDGTQGYLVTNHWTAWVPFWIIAPLVLAACAYGVWLAKQHAWLRPFTGTTAILSVVGIAAALWLILHVVLVWYWELKKTWLLITKKNIFVSRMEHWFFNVVDAHPLDECQVITHSSSWILPGLRSVELRVEAQTLMHMQKAGGGNAISHALETLRGAK